MTADDVIVGSGVNALMAAARLGKKSRTVPVLERDVCIDGCIRTEAITSSGFLHGMASGDSRLLIARTLS